MRLASLTLLSMLAAALAGCQDSGIDLAARSQKVVVGAQTPVAIESLDGPPDQVAPRFSAALASAAQAREIRFVDASGAPRFRLRGYLSAYPSDGGTTLAWVWDVYDSTLKRARRVSGSHPIRSVAGDPWSVVDDGALRTAAGLSLDGVGRFLNGTDRAAPPAGEPTAPQASSAD